MNYLSFKSIIFYSLMISFSIFPMEEVKEKTSSHFGKNIMIGSAAGTAEVLVNQPFVFIKNQLQQQAASVNKREVLQALVMNVKKSPSQLYRGLGVNTVCMVPTTAAQLSMNEELKKIIFGDDLLISVVRNAVAGAFSAITCNPSELIIINQQNWKANAWHTAQRLHRENGLLVGMRGYSAKALRDATFCAGFLTAYPKAKEWIQEQMGSSAVATILATTFVGPATAAASHPFDTVSTRMQADASKKNVKGFLDAVKAIYAEGGSKAFFLGISPRTARTIIAIPLMTAVKDRLSKKS